MTTPVTFRPYVAPEDQARADFYALISRLFADAPDQPLLDAIASAGPLTTEDAGAPLAQAWGNLIATATVADVGAMREEYDALFIGVGKSLLNLHASHHLTGFMMEKPLAELRNTLAKLGLGRFAGQNTLEDHLAALTEVMRILILGTNDFAAQPLAVQREFFEKHIATWFRSCCTAILKSSVANLYKPVAQYAYEFLCLEQEGLALGN
jgi:TorA maturation chaperone TorD